MPNSRVITNSKTRLPRFASSPSGERANCSLRWHHTQVLVVRDDLEGMKPRLYGQMAPPVRSNWKQSVPRSGKISTLEPVPTRLLYPRLLLVLGFGKSGLCLC
jgi:hypothetical protein